MSFVRFSLTKVNKNIHCKFSNKDYRKHQLQDVLNIGLIRMNILMLDTRNVETNEDVRMYT